MLCMNVSIYSAFYLFACLFPFRGLLQFGRGWPVFFLFSTCLSHFWLRDAFFFLFLLGFVSMLYFMSNIRILCTFNRDEEREWKVFNKQENMVLLDDE